VFVSDLSLGARQELWQDYRMTGLPVPWCTAAATAAMVNPVIL